MHVDIDHAGPAVSRRDALRITLAAAAMMVVAGCQTSPGSSELEAANKALRNTLEGMPASKERRARLVAIARRIETQSEAMLDDFRAFYDEFDKASIDRTVSGAELERMGREFQTRRVAQRNEMLELQDELRAELTDEEWQEVVETLNRKAASLTRSTRKSRV